jgi:hypothetical protein
MLEFGTYVETTTDCIRARVWVRGFRVDAVVLGWSGIVVHLTWRSDMGGAPRLGTSCGRRAEVTRLPAGGVGW